MKRRTPGSAEQDARMRQLWDENKLTIMQIAAELGVMELDVIAAARRLKFPSKTKSPVKLRRPVGDPTKKEIFQRAAQIRSRWTEIERRARAGALESKRWIAPQARERAL